MTCTWPRKIAYLLIDFYQAAALFLVLRRGNVNEPLEVRNSLGTDEIQVAMAMHLFCKDGSNISVCSWNEVGCSGQLGENDVVQSGGQLVEGRRVLSLYEERRYPQLLPCRSACRQSPAI